MRPARSRSPPKLTRDALQALKRQQDHSDEDTDDMTKRFRNLSPSNVSQTSHKYQRSMSSHQELPQNALSHTIEEERKSRDFLRVPNAYLLKQTAQRSSESRERSGSARSLEARPASAHSQHSSAKSSKLYSFGGSDYSDDCKPHVGKGFVNMTYFSSWRKQVESRDYDLLSHRFQMPLEELDQCRRLAIRPDPWSNNASDQRELRQSWLNLFLDCGTVSAKTVPLLGVMAPTDHKYGQELSKILKLEKSLFEPVFCENRTLHLIDGDVMSDAVPALHPVYGHHFCQECLFKHVINTQNFQQHMIGNIKCQSGFHPRGIYDMSSQRKSWKATASGYHPREINRIEARFTIEQLGNHKLAILDDEIPPSMICLYCRDHKLDPAEYDCPKILFRVQYNVHLGDTFKEFNQHETVKQAIKHLQEFGMWHSSAHAHMSGDHGQDNWVSATNSITFLAAYAMTVYRDHQTWGEVSIWCVDTSQIQERVVQGWKSYKESANHNLGSNYNYQHARLFESEKEYLIYKGFDDSCVAMKVNMCRFLEAFPKPSRPFAGDRDDFHDQCRHFIEAFGLEPHKSTPTRVDILEIEKHMSQMVTSNSDKFKKEMKALHDSFYANHAKHYGPDHVKTESAHDDVMQAVDSWCDKDWRTAYVEHEEIKSAIGSPWSMSPLPISSAGSMRTSEEHSRRSSVQHFRPSLESSR